MHGTWTTTGGTTVSASGILTLLGAGYVLLHPREFSDMVTTLAVAAVCVVGAVIVIAAACAPLLVRYRRAEAESLAAYRERYVAAMAARTELRVSQVQALPPVMHYHNDLHIHQHSSGADREQAPVLHAIPVTEAEELPR
jgi:hypothetical protein